LSKWALRRAIRCENLYVQGGDSNGLSVHERLKGASAENVHQKLHVGVGPFGIGIKSAHNILLNIIFHYNVNTGIARCGEPDVGHPWNFYQDRIQYRIEEIWDCTIYPTHINILAFKPTDFVAVGIGPLSYDKRFIKTGPPTEHLTGDFIFMAWRTKCIVRQCRCHLVMSMLFSFASCALYRVFN
jgi:hypothetical protein